MKRQIASSELILNNDGSIFHLHLRPEQLADTVILVGDPARVEQVASYFDDVEFKVSNREFFTATGSLRGRRMSVVSTGIGTDNIDIVVNELDALANIDFVTRTEKDQKKSLTLLRLGTCGALQPDIEIGDFIMARTSIGFDGLLNYYHGRNGICDLAMEKAFKEHVQWNPLLASPYCVNCSRKLLELFAGEVIEGITIAAPGFYAPQGRWLRLAPADPDLNTKIESFRYNNGRRITNFEMESSALAGLARLMGHEASTICTVIAQRVERGMNTDYREFVNKMIVMSLEKLSSF